MCDTDAKWLDTSNGCNSSRRVITYSKNNRRYSQKRFKSNLFKSKKVRAHVASCGIDDQFKRSNAPVKERPLLAEQETVVEPVTMELTRPMTKSPPIFVGSMGNRKSVRVVKENCRSKINDEIPDLTIDVCFGEVNNLPLTSTPNSSKVLGSLEDQLGIGGERIGDFSLIPLLPSVREGRKSGDKSIKVGQKQEANKNIASIRTVHCEKKENTQERDIAIELLDFSPLPLESSKKMTEVTRMVGELQSPETSETDVTPEQGNSLRKRPQGSSCGRKLVYKKGMDRKQNYLQKLKGYKECILCLSRKHSNKTSKVRILRNHVKLTPARIIEFPLDVLADI